MNIEIWSVGKSSEPFIDAGLTYYFQKTMPFVNISLTVLTNKKSSAEVSVVKKEEETLILKKLHPSHYLILLDEKGRILSSPQWAKAFQQCMNQSVKTMVLLIGGAYGVSEEVRIRAKQTWSLSALVFPHQLVRLIVAEQVYRAFNILNNTGYHHS